MPTSSSDDPIVEPDPEKGKTEEPKDAPKEPNRGGNRPHEQPKTGE